MKIISWNVNGIRAILKKNFLSFIDKEDPDIICIQETRATPDQVEDVLPDYSNKYWNSAERPGYSGTSIFSKKPAISRIGLEKDEEGRVTTLEFNDFFLVNIYAPNVGHELNRTDYRKKWDNRLRQHIRKLDERKPVIVTGDFNVAHREIDVFNPKPKYNKTPKYTQTEIVGMDKHLNAGFIDVFRNLYPDKIEYTQWRFGGNLREDNKGWRIDYFLISDRMIDRVEDMKHFTNVKGSDHCPIGIYLI